MKRSESFLAINHQRNGNKDENKNDQHKKGNFSANGIKLGDLVEGFCVCAP